MPNTLTFEEYIAEALKDEDIKNEYDYDDYSIVVDVDYTTQE